MMQSFTDISGKVHGRPAWALAFALGVAAAHAEPLPADPLERECWLRSTFDRTQVRRMETTQLEFGNLRNGMTVDHPFAVDFSVQGMGIVPAGNKMDRTGHHHLLIDTPLPALPTNPIPFSKTHVHFGKGQTSTVLDLPPGRHTLRLLFADHDHKPYFVFSREIAINVRGPRGPNAPKVDRAQFDATCDAWYGYVRSQPHAPGERIYFENLRDQEPVRSPFKVRFGVDGRFVGAKAAAVKGTGHFALDVVSGAKTVQATTLVNGATEEDFDLPRGNYTLRLRYVDSQTGKEALDGVEIGVVVLGPRTGTGVASAK